MSFPPSIRCPLRFDEITGILVHFNLFRKNPRAAVRS